MLRRIAVAAALSVSALAAAQDAGVPAAPAAPPYEGAPPTAEMIKKVLDYQEKGAAAGPVLLDLVPCLKVDNAKGSPTQFQCIEPVGDKVPKGTTVFAWLQWLCPKDGKYEDVQIQFLHEGQVRKTVDNPVAGFGRTRGWRGENFNKVGTWTIKVIRGAQELGSKTVNVVAN
jgi:hypothetical protein